MSDRPSPQPATARPSGPLRGIARVPGDRSISHRAVILGGLASGDTLVSGLPDSDCIRRTAAAMRSFGARIEEAGRDWRISGVGNGCLLEPDRRLDVGDCLETAHLVMGLCGAYDMRTDIVGDAALARRPMGRVLDPLRLMGVQVQAVSGDRLPLSLRGPRVAAPISYRVPLASSLVKSCVLLAGLNTPGVTTVIESMPTPDHTERLLRTFGARVETETDAGGLRQIRVVGQGLLAGQSIAVPGDPACAASLVVAALIVPGSDLRIENMLVNPTRMGLIATLREMGGSIDIANRRTTGGEDVADLRLRFSDLNGVTVPADRAPSMAEEHAALAVAAAFARGETRIEGLDELRADDRLAALVAGLSANGVDCGEAGRDSLVVRGSGEGGVAGGGRIETRGDPLVAAAFLALGLASEQPVEIDDAGALDRLFPDYVALLRRLGATIEHDSANGEMSA